MGSIGIFAYQTLDRRAVAEIQKNIIERGQRNGLSRMFHAKNDKETIATWRVDLNRILHVFNVCGVTPARPSLTAHFQTELAINTHTIVSNIHRTIVDSQEVADGKNRSVSAILLPYSLPNQHSPLPRVNLGWWSQLLVNPASHICV